MPATKSPTSIKGIDKPSCSPTRYKFRGRGPLKIASSQWEVIAYGNDWVMTYFAKTLFTPAGLDLYVRTPATLSNDALDEITRQAAGAEGQVGQLAAKFFTVPVSEQ